MSALTPALPVGLQTRPASVTLGLTCECFSDELRCKSQHPGHCSPPTHPRAPQQAAPSPGGQLTPWLAPNAPSAFQDVFSLFSSGLTHTVDMRSMKLALHSAGIQLSPRGCARLFLSFLLQEVCPINTPPYLTAPAAVVPLSLPWGSLGEKHSLPPPTLGSTRNFFQHLLLLTNPSLPPSGWGHQLQRLSGCPHR